MTIVNLVERRTQQMDDGLLLAAVYSCGKIMERGNLTNTEKLRCYTILTEAANRPGLEEHKEMILITLRVLKYF